MIYNNINNSEYSSDDNDSNGDDSIKNTIIDVSILIIIMDTNDNTDSGNDGNDNIDAYVFSPSAALYTSRRRGRGPWTRPFTTSSPTPSSAN